MAFTKAEILALIATVANAPPEYVDVAAVYGVVADGSTDNATDLMTMRTALAGPNKPHYILQFPSGEIRYSNNRFLVGIERFTVEGNGSRFRSIYSGGDEKFQRPFNSGGLWEDDVLSYTGGIVYTPSYLINTVGARSKTITCTTAGQAANFSVGDRVLIWGYDQVGNGYPPGIRYKEWHTVIGVDAGTGILTLDLSLVWAYNSNVWDVPDILGTGNNSGKPRVTSLDRTGFTYTRHAEFKNVIFGAPTGGTDPSGTMQFVADTLILKNCAVEGHFWPTECRVAEFTDVDVIANPALFASEFDKVVGIMTCTRVNFRNEVSNGGGIDVLRVTDCQGMESIGACAKVIEWKNNSFSANLYPNTSADSLGQPPAKNPTRRVVLDSCAFSSTASSVSTAHVNIGKYNSYTIVAVSGTSIIIPFISFTDAVSTQLPYQAEAGITRIFKSDGTKNGYCTSISFDATYNSGQGAFVIAGTWPAPVAAEVWRWSPVSEVIDMGNHTILDTKRLWNAQSIRWGGNKAGRGQIHTMKLDASSFDWAAGGSGLIIDIYGKILDIEIIVGKPWNGTDPTMTMGIHDSSFAFLALVNVLLSGRRFVSKDFAQGSQSGDTITSAESLKMGVWYQTLYLVAYTTSFVAPTDQSIEARPDFTMNVRWVES